MEPVPRVEAELAERLHGTLCSVLAGGPLLLLALGLIALSSPGKLLVWLIALQGVMVLGPLGVAGLVHVAVASTLLRAPPGQRWSHDRAAVVAAHERAAVAGLLVLAVECAFGAWVFWAG